MARFSAIKILESGSFQGIEERDSGTEINFRAAFPLFLIREAWNRGCDFEDLADGFDGFALHLDPASGEGDLTPGFKGTRGDWSGIRDSSDEAKNRMFERALNFFFDDEAS